MNTFGKRLKELRSKENTTQITVAEYLGITKQAYSLYESDKREPDIDKIKALSSFFMVPANFLLGTGVFENWEQISKNTEIISEMLQKTLSEILPEIKLENNISLFISILDILIEKIESDKDNNITLYYKIPNRFSYKNTTVDFTSVDESDDCKKRLLYNYENLNDTGKAKLLDYSDDLVSNNKYVKSNIQDTKMNT